MSDELIVRHCAPTLAGLKTGNLFVVKVGCDEAFRRRLRELNRTLASKGLRVIPVKRTERKAWVYVYRPSRLKRDLDNSLAREILEKKRIRMFRSRTVHRFADIENAERRKLSA